MIFSRKKFFKEKTKTIVLLLKPSSHRQNQFIKKFIILRPKSSLIPSKLIKLNHHFTIKTKFHLPPHRNCEGTVRTQNGGLPLLVGGATGGGFETLRGDKTNCFITNPKLTN